MNRVAARTAFGYLVVVTSIVLSTLGVSAQQTPAPPPEVREHMLQIAKELPADSFLRHELESGGHGDGVAHPWMDVAKHDGVERAVIKINFTWYRGLHDLKVVRVMLFRGYDGPESQITDPKSSPNLRRMDFRLH